MSTFTVVHQDVSDREIIRLYLENRSEMDYDERKMFLEYIALFLSPKPVWAPYDGTATAKNEALK